MRPGPASRTLPALPLAALLAIPLASSSFPAACAKRTADSFSVSGSVTVAPRFRRRALRNNTILVVTASTDAGIPVAVKRFINPKLPLRYELRKEDLLLQDPEPGEELIVRASINTHGKLGRDAPGDLVGIYGSPVSSGERNANIVIDREI